MLEVGLLDSAACLSLFGLLVLWWRLLRVGRSVEELLLGLRDWRSVYQES